jgi:hypothetical protein
MHYSNVLDINCQRIENHYDCVNICCSYYGRERGRERKGYTKVDNCVCKPTNTGYPFQDTQSILKLQENVLTKISYPMMSTIYLSTSRFFSTLYNQYETEINWRLRLL